MDTTDDVYQVQLDIILSKSEPERALLGVDMIDSVYEIVKNSIKQKRPDISEKRLVSEIFLRYYSSDFPQEELIKIANRIRNRI